jgi:uncharacterized protein (TIGR02996 family)
MSERDAFLKALAENEDDTTTRLVYADWLDDHGEHEEADRQRKWTPAKAWLVRFCREHNPDHDDDDDDGDDDSYFWIISYKRLLRLGREAVEGADTSGFGFDCGANETMCNALRDNRREFWTNWSIVTGIAVPLDVTESYFGCSC